MAAIGNQQKYWGEANANNANASTYVNKIKGLSCEQLQSRALLVHVAVCNGSVMGGLIGNAAAPGVGAVPGFIIGASVGLVGSLAANNIYDFVEYRDYKAKLTKGARDSLESVVLERLGEDAQCAIGQEVAVFPVKIDGEPQIYERAAIEKWLVKNGTSPMSRKPCNMADVKPSFEHMARLGKACDEVLNDPQERDKLHEHELKGLVILRAGVLQIVEDVYEKNLNALIEDKKQKKITPRQFAEKVAEMAEFADPIIGEEAAANRR